MFWTKLILKLFVVIVFFSSCKFEKEKKTEADNVDFVNTLMGTESDRSFSNGNTLPIVGLPWGMNYWTPQTGKMDNGWIYKYRDHKITGIRETHQPSPWIKDYGAFSLMAVTGKLKFDAEERASWFSHKAETAKPYYYSAYLADYDVNVEVTPTERAASFRFTFPKNDSSYILLDAFSKGSKVVIIPNERKIIGYCRNNNGGVPNNFHNYFVVVFNKNFEVSNTWIGDSLHINNLEEEGNHVGAIIGFKTHKGEVIQANIASSFISLEQAELNLKREIGTQNFDSVRLKAKQIWNRELGKIQVEGGSPSHIETFYSSLYRMMLFPMKFFEKNQHGDIIHYSPFNGKVLPGYMFTNGGFWDTFRAEYPFFTLMHPKLDSQIMQGLVNTYKESGWLPEWVSPGHRDCMVGSYSASIIADTYLKGTRGFNMDTLYKALIKNTKGYMPEVNSVGRYGFNFYNKLGYVPCDVGIDASVSRTLAYAYADFCLWQLAKKLGKPQEEIDLFAQRAQNYKNIFDPETKLMRPKNKDGTFRSPFNPLKWGDAFSEGNSLQYTWSVLHDIQGLIGLMGSDKEFISMLDTVFNTPPHFDCSYYGFPIHEIREMQTQHMGNYAHSNEPDIHIIYLYNYAGAPWKAQSLVRKVMDNLYSPDPDGYPGDEDNGQLSAWFVFSAIGFYPVCPGSNQYVFGSPLFKKVTLSFENGKELIIEANGNNKKNVYVKEIIFNHKKWLKNYILHNDILKGGKLNFIMASEPNFERGISKESFPYSMTPFNKRNN